jgi:O-antigen/teichoic acid export membrane protein
MLGPIAAFALSNWLSILAKRVNVIALSMTTSLAAVGIYSAANSFAEISFVVTAVVAQLALPQLSRTLATEPREALRHYEGMIRLLFSATLPLAAGAIWFAGPIVSLAFGPEFAGSVPVLRVLMLVFLFDSTDTLMSLLLKAAGRQNQDVRLYAPNPVVNLALNLVLIPWLGPTGSALAKGAGTLSSWLLRARASARLGFGASWLRLARRPAVATVAALAPAVLAGRFVGAPAQLAGYAALSAVLFLRWTGAERADTLTSGAGRSAGGEEGRA